METAQLIEKLPKSKLRRIMNDPVKTAEAIDLRYVNDEEEGYSRKKRGKYFSYYFKEKK